MKTTKVKIATTLKLLLLGCMAVTFSNNSALGYGPGKNIDSVVIGQLPPFDLPPEGGIKKPKLKNDRASSIRKAPRGQNAYRRSAGGGNGDGTLGEKRPEKTTVTCKNNCPHGDDCLTYKLLGIEGNRVRSNVDGQKYDDFKWLLDPRYPERSRLNDDGRPTVDGQKYDDRDPSLDPRRPERPVPSKRSRPNVNGRPDVDGQPATNEQLGIPNTGGHLNGPTPIPPPPEPYKRKGIVRDYQNQGPVPHDLAHEQQNRQRSNTSRRAASGNGEGTGQCAGCGNVYSSCNCPESLLPPPPERSRPNVDGQKYDDRDPSLDPRRPERPVPSKRSRPNVNGRSEIERQENGGLIGIAKTGGHLNGPTDRSTNVGNDPTFFIKRSSDGISIPPPPEPYQIDKHGKIRFSEHSPEKKRTVIVRDSPPPNSTRVVRPRKSN